MRAKNRYKTDHLIAKAIVFMLYLLFGAASVEMNAPYLALVCGTLIWLFGVNTVGYLVESLAGHAHHHPLL